MHRRPGRPENRSRRISMSLGAKPFGEKKFIEIKGRRMAYIDEGTGDPILFQHGNPTSSYLWRNIMPHCAGLGRLIACDLIGMGDSDKLDPSGPERYAYAEHRDYLDALWEALDLGDRVVLVVHEIGRASCRERVSTCRSRWSPYHSKKKIIRIAIYKMTSKNQNIR